MDEAIFIRQNRKSESLKTDFQNLNYETRKEFDKESLEGDQDFGNGDTCSFEQGDLVWVNVKGSPLWPAMITIPQNESSYTKFGLKKSTKKSVGPKQYHVQFFCDNYRTMWVSSKTIFIYEGFYNLRSYCKKLQLHVKSCKKGNLFAKRNLLKAFSKLTSRTNSSNNSKSLQWNQAVLEADQVLPLERCERILKYKAPLLKEKLNKSFGAEKNYKETSISSPMLSSIDLGLVSPSSSIKKGKWKSPSSTSDSSDEDYSMDGRKSKRCNSLKRLKQRSQEDLLEVDFDIKHEIEIKEEPLELCDEYLCHESESIYESMMYHKQTLGNCSGVLSSFKPIGKESVKIEVDNEDMEVKKEFFGYVEDDQEFKIEIQGRYIRDENPGLKVEGNILNQDSHVDEETLFRRLENSDFPKVVRRLNVGSEKSTEICTDVQSVEQPCGSNFGKIEVKHEETFDEVQNAIIEDNDYDIKADIDVKNEDIEDFIEDQSNNSIIRERNIKDIKSGITIEPKRVTESFDSASPSSSGLRSGKRNIIEMKNEERKKEGNKIKDFESRKKIKLDEKFECSLCEYKTESKGNLRSHSLIHSTVILFKCFACDYECNGKRNFKRHLLSHSNVKLFKCSECDYECKEKRNLKSHLLSHSNVKLFKCSECDYECNHYSNLKRHLLSHSNVKLFKCSECDYECKEKRNLKSHLLSHSNVKLFKCSECDYECNQKGQLKIHLLSHMNVMLFKCSKCDYECNDKSSFKRHLLSHSNVKLFRCYECDFECNYKSSLKCHLLSHSNVKLFKCSECDFECNDKRNLKRHLLSHSTIKLFKCFECDYECNQRGQLKNHLLSHSNVKLFKCSECDYACNQKSHLKRHLLSHSRRKNGQRRGVHKESKNDAAV